MLDKLLYEEEVKRCVMTFEQQFHYAIFYSYMKLREQEIRNIMWISECVAQVRRHVMFVVVIGWKARHSWPGQMPSSFGCKVPKGAAGMTIP